MPAPEALRRLVVVGGSAAGLAFAEEARRRGYTGTVTLIDAEPGLPYDRPPLSKQLLAGEWEPDRLLLRPKDQWDALDITHLPATTASGVDTASDTVRLTDGGELPYDALVIATGAQAVHPASLGAGLPGVQVLRNLPDALRLRTALEQSGRLVVVGAGFVGAEASAVARRMGVPVTMIDPLPLPLANVLGDEVAALLAARHRAAGVDLRCGTGVTEVLAENGRATAVVLDDGSIVEASTVLVAVGARPAVGWLKGSGIPLGDRARDGVEGVLCDADGRVAPKLWAVGDVAARLDPATGRHVRAEHRLAATEQGRAVAAAVLGAGCTAPPSLPYFWSDQYDLKLQSYGATGRRMAFTVVEGSLADGRFVGVYGHRDAAGRPHRVDGVLGNGMARALRTWRTAVLDRAPWPVTAATADAPAIRQRKAI
ncbi:NAD(P)/FAD-dependent oxidoreductase [Streptomyces acidiscabies]|uniref:NAD(P)/FAD-dependent oxidoreductase n=1 Tax=Streptomyces acidiscabies TaxID=42234 RepID=UPI000952EE22|nr:FAD-dependent oxidoreductase [Streptomyces acidiscabies]